MKITKYTQSCLKIDNNEGTSLLVDVGTLTTGEYKVEDFGAFDAVLFTHSHFDHFDIKILPQLAATGAAIYGNADVAQSAGDTAVEIIENGEELVIAGFKIKACHMEHCLMVNGEPAGIPNTGFLINDSLLLPGDSTQDVGMKADTIALPIFGPDISYKDAFAQLKTVGASKAIPVHYDVAGINPESFTMLAQLGAQELGAEIHALSSGESIEI